MTERVDFYVLKSSAATPRLTFVCRLAEKAYLRDMTVVVLNDSDAQAAALDELLWTFSERSFVPHELCRGPSGPETAPTAETARPAGPATVRLTPDLKRVGKADLLVNLSAQLPEDLGRFTRIAEVIDGDADRRRLGRERFKAYRDLQVAVETHQLDEISGAPSA